MITRSTEYKLCVTIPSTGDQRIIQAGSKKLMVSARKRAAANNPNLHYEVVITSKLVGEIVRKHVNVG